MKKHNLQPVLFSILFLLSSYSFSKSIQIPKITKSGQTYIALPTLIDSLQIKGKWELPSLHFTAQTPGGLFSISQDNPYILIGEKFYKQPTPPIFHNDTLWVIPQPLIAMLQKVLPLKLDWQNNENTLKVEEIPRLQNFKLTLSKDTLSIEGLTRIGDSISYQIDSNTLSFTFPIVQILDNIAIYPLTVGKSLKLSPLAVILAILFGGKAAGVLGILLAVPLLAMALSSFTIFHRSLKAYRIL